MQLRSIKVRNVGPFRGEYSVNFADHPGPIVAVVGANGRGKSTILELAGPGSFYRSTPTRGSLVDLATARDAMVETEVVNGQPWTLRHLIDKVSGKSEAFVLDGAGVSVLPDSKVRSFDAWAASHLPAPEVLYACMFAPQGAGGFLAAKPGERKATLLRVLGVEHLEELAERMRENERQAKAELATLEARLADERARVGDAAALRDEAVAAADRSGNADTALEAAREDLARKEADDRELVEQRKVVADRSRERASITAALEVARTRVADLEGRARNNRAVLAEAATIRRAEERRAELTGKIAAAGADVATLDAEARRMETEATSAADRLRPVVARIGRAEEALRGRDAVEAAADALESLEAAARVAARDVDGAQEALDAIQGQRVEGADDRIKFLRQGLETIVRRCPNPDAVAASTLEHDNTAVKLAAEQPARAEAAMAALRAARERKVDADNIAGAARTTAARKASLDAAAEDLRLARDEGRALEAQKAGAGMAEQQKAASASAMRARVAELQAEDASLAPLAAKAGPLAGAEGRLAELVPQLDNARRVVAQGENELERLPALPDVQVAVDVSGARRYVAEAERIAREAASALAVSEQRLKAATAGAERLVGLERDRDAAGAELADWTRLALDLGRDGLQAAEIDAAGPELTELVNDLLHTCHGPRFTVRIETQRASADGKRVLEGCDVVVLDTVGGREAQGETFSGGERVIIGEALSLALSMLACRRAGLEGVTLVRDESGAALDPENARTYVAMLRRAATLVRADKVLFVSHSTEVIEMADSRIEIA